MQNFQPWHHSNLPFRITYVRPSRNVLQSHVIWSKPYKTSFPCMFWYYTTNFLMLPMFCYHTVYVCDVTNVLIPYCRSSFCYQCFATILSMFLMLPMFCYHTTFLMLLMFCYHTVYVFDVTNALLPYCLYISDITNVLLLHCLHFLMLPLFCYHTAYTLWCYQSYYQYFATTLWTLSDVTNVLLTYCLYWLMYQWY